MTTQGPLAIGSERDHVDQGALSHSPPVLIYNDTSSDLLIQLTLCPYRILSKCIYQR